MDTVDTSPINITDYNDYIGLSEGGACSWLGE